VSSWQNSSTGYRDRILRRLFIGGLSIRITALGFEPVDNSPQEFGAYLKADLVKWAKVAKEIGAKAE
jgi:hypothetical protein